MKMQLHKLIQSVTSRGCGGTLKWIFRSYFTVNEFIVFCKELNKPFYYDFNNQSTIIRKLSLTEYRIIRGNKKNLPVEFYSDQLYNFHNPFVAFVNGDLAAVHWLVLPGEMSRFLMIKDKDVEINYNTVLPKFRGMGLAEKLMAFMILYCCEKGYNRMFGVVNVSNIPQYKQMIRLGFEPIEVLVHFGLHRPKAKLRYI